MLNGEYRNSSCFCSRTFTFSEDLEYHKHCFGACRHSNVKRTILLKATKGICSDSLTNFIYFVMNRLIQGERKIYILWRRENGATLWRRKSSNIPCRGTDPRFKSILLIFKLGRQFRLRQQRPKFNLPIMFLKSLLLLNLFMSGRRKNPVAFFSTRHLI